MCKKGWAERGLGRKRNIKEEGEIFTIMGRSENVGEEKGGIWVRERFG